jgi:DNA-binding GntR family transcriptional regulator
LQENSGAFMGNKKAKQNKRANVFAVLRDQIVDGHYPQGVKLIEQDLAQEFGVSRAMLREIFAELEIHGLVEKLPNRGTMVRRIDSRSLLEVMEIREVLEGLAARLAAQKSKPSDWRDLEKEFGEPFEQIVKNLDFEKYLDFVAYFRERMVTAAQSEELCKLIIPIYAKIRIVQRRIAILPGRMQQAIKEHRAVLKAIIEGNPEKAEQKKRINMKNARDCLEKYKSWVL